MLLRTRLFTALVVLACLSLTACDSSGSSTSSGTPTSGTGTGTGTGTGASYTISGAVTGANNVTIQLNGVATNTTTTNSSGGFSFNAGTGNYTIGPNRSGYVFTPVSRAAIVKAASVDNLGFSANPNTALTYTISGTVVGSVTAGVLITLNGANVGSAVTDLGGNYTFSNLVSGTYTVSASLAGFAFTKPLVIPLGATDSLSNNFTSTTAPVGGNLAFTPVNPLPQATVGSSYSVSLVKSATGGTAPYYYQSATIASGTPPLGMIVNPNGDLTGTPAAAGVYSFSVCAIDSTGDSSPCEPTSITVVAATVSPTPPPASGTSWVYHDGQFSWPGDYSFVATPDYSDTTGGPLSGAYDIKVTMKGPWGGWLPYAQNWKFDSRPYTKLTFALKPTVANQSWDIYFVKVGDIPVGISVDPTKYGPAPVVGQWATYTIPLADLGVLGTMIYKFCIHDLTGMTGNVWYVDNVGFVP